VSLGTWCELDAAGHIHDPALAAPLPIEVMIHAARADDAVARALLVKRNPVLEATRARDRAEGHAAGKAEAVIAIVTVRGLSPDHASRARILGERDLARLDRWITRAMTCATIAELFTEP
jgi:hypothetical protein